MKLTTAHAPRAVWGAPGDSTSPERWAMTWKTLLSGYVSIDEDTDHGMVIRQPMGTLIVCGLNPSTAWAQDGLGELDPTLTRIHGFAQGLGVSDVCMVNLYPQRYTDPDDLWDALGPSFDGAFVGTKTWSALYKLNLPEPFTLVAAWGTTAPRKGCRSWWPAVHWSHARIMGRLLRDWNRGQIWCWGTTKAGHPRHPLYLPATAKLQPWSAP